MADSYIAAMNTTSLEHWQIPGLVEIVDGRGGLPRIEIHTPIAEADIYLHGAHITHFAPRGAAPVLFMSEKSHFAAGKAIRGGVPVIFPWFGPREGHPESPMHGFARTSEWQIEDVEAVGDAVIVKLRLDSSEATRALWPHDFSLRLRVTVSRTLAMWLETTNRSSQPFTFEAALHTYLAVGDARKATVTGLEGAEFIDKVDAFSRKQQGSEPIAFTSETDRVYLHTDTACTLHDPATPRQIVVEKTGSQTTVVWNPWIAKAAALADFGDDEWPHMVCIETANAAENAVTIAPGETHTMTATISALK